MLDYRTKDVAKFGGFVDGLETLVRSILRRGALGDTKSSAVVAALDGQPSAELRRLVSVAARRHFGAFFTGSRIATNLIAPYAHLVARPGIIEDPACGAGDLLVAYASRMTHERTLSQTLECWGERLRGSDLVTPFVRATRLRLILEALRRAPTIDTVDLRRLTGYLHDIR